MKIGKVWLVGAGPGDVGLLTVAGYEILQKAEVVLYDQLVGDGILCKIPREAEKINVGKYAGNHTLPQDGINRLLVEKAKSGKCVVRLKGGDPFLFGRGGEEVEVLLDAGIPYEVISGVPSAIAVAAANGIPVTHRDYCSSVHIITGHRRVGEEYNIDFSALVHTHGTLIFLMGVGSLSFICKELINAGMPKDMPAAVLSRGTTARQSKQIGTVSDLPQKAQQVPTPAIIVVGEVCRLSEPFSWKEQLPLFGIKIVVTRPQKKESVLADQLRSLGAEVLECPSIRMEANRNMTLLENCLEGERNYQWLIFTSPAGVDIFFEQLKKSKRDIRSLFGIKVAVIGKGTKRACEDRGILVDYMPSDFNGRALAKGLIDEIGTDTVSILMPRANIGNPIISEILREAGHEVDDVGIYDTRTEAHSFLPDMEYDGAAFTSASAVDGFWYHAHVSNPERITAYCIGEVTAARARHYGMKTVIAKEATIDSLVKVIAGE